HIFRHEAREGCETVLLWQAGMGGGAIFDDVMKAVAESYCFAGAYALDQLRINGPRAGGPLRWPIEFIRRNVVDARRVRSLLAKHLQANPRIEVWTDDPIHFITQFVHALFPGAVRVKFPHAFNLENRVHRFYRSCYMRRRQRQATLARRLLWNAV